MKKVYLAVLIFITVAVSAQDIHFSQYYASPLTLNPAFTGNINGDFRVAFNYRNQWFNVPTIGSVAPYQTYQASFDMPLFREKLGNDGFGVGGMFYGDKAGDGALTTYTGMASIAYHKSTDRYGKGKFSLGIQAGVVSKQVNITTLVFENQLDNYGFNTALSNGESNFNNKAIIYPDVNIGALWTHAPREKIHYYFGIAMDHLAQPRQSFLTDETSRLNYLFIGNAGMEIFLNNDNTLSLSPGALYMLQANAQQVNVGLAVNYYLSDVFGIFGGGWFRIGDAAILNAGVEVYDVRIGMSYDFNYSGLKEATHAQGAAELSVIYIFKKQKPGKIANENFCPNF